MCGPRLRFLVDSLRWGGHVQTGATYISKPEVEDPDDVIELRTENGCPYLDEWEPCQGSGVVHNPALPSTPVYVMPAKPAVLDQLGLRPMKGIVTPEEPEVLPAIDSDSSGCPPLVEDSSDSNKPKKMNKDGNPASDNQAERVRILLLTTGVLSRLNRLKSASRHCSQVFGMIGNSRCITSAVAPSVRCVTKLSERGSKGGRQRIRIRIMSC